MPESSSDYAKAFAVGAGASRPHLHTVRVFFWNTPLGSGVPIWMLWWTPPEGSSLARVERYEKGLVLLKYCRTRASSVIMASCPQRCRDSWKKQSRSALCGYRDPHTLLLSQAETKLAVSCILCAKGEKALFWAHKGKLGSLLNSVQSNRVAVNGLEDRSSVELLYSGSCPGLVSIY